MLLEWTDGGQPCRNCVTGSLRLPDNGQPAGMPACEHHLSSEQHAADCSSAQALEHEGALKAHAQPGTSEAPSVAPQPLDREQAPCACGNSKDAVSSAPEPPAAPADAKLSGASGGGECALAAVVPQAEEEVGPAATPEACRRGAQEALPAGCGGNGAPPAAAPELFQEAGPTPPAAARGCEAHELESLKSSLSDSEAHDSDGSSASWPPSGGLASHTIMSRVGDDEPCGAEDAFAWRAALERKAAVSLPLTWPPGSAAAGFPVPGGAAAHALNALNAAAGPLQPERERVFSDLHARGCGSTPSWVVCTLHASLLCHNLTCELLVPRAWSARMLTFVQPSDCGVWVSLRILVSRTPRVWQVLHLGGLQVRRAVAAVPRRPEPVPRAVHRACGAARRAAGHCVAGRRAAQLARCAQAHGHRSARRAAELPDPGARSWLRRGMMLRRRVLARPRLEGQHASRGACIGGVLVCVGKC